MSRDHRDLGSAIATTLLDSILFEGEQGQHALREHVNVTGRQVNSNASLWVTLSWVRRLVTTMMFGMVGVDRKSILAEDLPCDLGTVTSEILKVSERIFTEHQAFFEVGRQTVLTTPAVAAGLGAAAHRAMSWYAGEDALDPDRLTALLSNVEWTASAAYWEGLFRFKDGKLNRGGGAKDSGSRIMAALLDPNSAEGRQIRD